MSGTREREAGFFFHKSISVDETVPTRYRMPLGGFRKCVFIRRQGFREGEEALQKDT